ncbi:hypothetical protein M011DRAFT_480269 [Sporormia fimetaria CBS 119925]|uniref:Uncharacterized protein n=1 Tax=Sporormia fimetaria CBS 119925 TaxID=1340428 RepID=A0A6A6V293_9PLEO|nr:hypothetical protein M011DRAFT_480269 [Sporormia fimetaria CBS 119925]
MYIPRDNVIPGYTLHPSIIIFLTILGAGVAVLCGFVLHRTLVGLEGWSDDAAYRARSEEQEEYMRGVRERGFRALWTSSGGGRGRF